MTNWSTTKVAKLTELTSILHNQYKKAPMSGFRRAYSDLERKSDNFRLTLQKLTPLELESHSLYKGEDPVLIIEREKSDIDRELAVIKAKNTSKSQNARVDNSSKKFVPPLPKGMPQAFRDERGILGERPKVQAMYTRPQQPPLPTYPPPYMGPSVSYRPPSYGPPQPVYSHPPHQSYGPPQPVYSHPPQQSYGPPPPSYGPPPQSYGQSQMGYKLQPISVVEVHTDPRTGLSWYIDPHTGNVVMRNPHTGRWEMKGPPHHSGQMGRGEYNRTFKNRQRYNNTKKHK
jgi:hypothetical protein